MTRLKIAAALAAALVVAATGAPAQDKPPTFQVDAAWPKQLPNNWILGNVVGIAVDKDDNIWVVHRPRTVPEYGMGATFTPPRSECCTPAPPVLLFDQTGNLLRSWGGNGQGYEWPESEHGIYVDYKGNIWVGGNGAKDSQILKFTPEGRFLLQIGRQGQGRGNTDTTNLGRPAMVSVDRDANEVYVSDGYGNRRIIVFDADTGQFKRMWGAYGNAPSDEKLAAYSPFAPPSQQFLGPVHCVTASRDGLLYVCDRTGDRIQIFKKDGSFVKETLVMPKTLGVGSTCDVAFSADPAQRFMYVADCSQMKVHVMLRETLETIGTIGGPGRGAGQFYLPHNIATDSKGNIYTGETLGMDRAQRFVATAGK